jgi:hypothetical protein
MNPMVATSIRVQRRGAAEAHHRRVTPVLLSILADNDQPDVARERAFRRIIAELETARRAASHLSTPIDNAA